MFPEPLESFCTLWKVSGHVGKFSDTLENLWTSWNVSGYFFKNPDSLESFRTSGNFQYIQESFQENIPQTQQSDNVMGVPIIFYLLGLDRGLELGINLRGI